MNLRRWIDSVMRRDAPPPDERSSKAVQTEALRDELGPLLDRVDRIVPPKHDRFASYGRIRLGR